jgi:hypothetical protein
MAIVSVGTVTVNLITESSVLFPPVTMPENSTGYFLINTVPGGVIDPDYFVQIIPILSQGNVQAACPLQVGYYFSGRAQVFTVTTPQFTGVSTYDVTIEVTPRKRVRGAKPSANEINLAVLWEDALFGFSGGVLN